MRKLLQFAACAALAGAATASPVVVASNVEIGYFSFDNSIPSGVNTFGVVNLTGGSSLGAEAPISTSITFQNASITYTTLNPASVNVVQLGNLTQGAATMPLSLQLPSSLNVVSAIFSATLSVSQVTINGTVQNLASNAITATLTPASVGSVTPIFVNLQAAAALSFTQQPSAGVAGVALSPAVTVAVGGGTNPLVTLTSTPAGTTAIAQAVNGVATFSNLIINTAQSYTLTATAPSVTGATSNSFAIAPAAPSKISFLQSPSNAVAGVAIAPAVTAQILDAFGNLTTSSATVALASTPAGLSASAAAVNGTATFSSLAITAAKGYTLTASSASLTSATSGSFSISPAPPTHLSFLQQPSNGTLGAALTPAVTVQLLDQYGNVSTSGATVSIASTPALITASAAAVNGTATFSTLVLGAGGTYTLTATSANISSVTSSAFTVGSGVLTLLTDKTAYSIGQIATLTGNFLSSSSAPISGATVVVNLTVNGATHTLSTTTNASGAYSTTYQPGIGDAGTVTTAAAAAGGGLVSSATGTFRVAGLQLTTSATSLTLVMGNSASQPLTILNSGNAAINAVNVTLTSNAPSSVTGKLTLTGVPTSLASGSSTPFTLNITTSNTLPPNAPVVFTITATGVDATSGVSVSQSTTVTATLEPATSSATLTPLSATLGVNPGASAAQQYSIRNTGYVAITNATVALTNPSATPWLVLGNGSLGTINPGQTAMFQAVANPPAALAAQTIAVPFTITGASSTVSATLTVNINPTGTTTGTATFSVADDLGQYVSGATVTLVSNANPAMTYQGATDANGNVTVMGVTAGDYSYVVAATQHDPGSGMVHVTAGGYAQPAVRKGLVAHVGPDVSGLPTAPTPISVTLAYDVVTLSFSVTPTTVTDTYVTQLLVLYSSYLVKPVLQVIPDPLNYTFYPQAAYPPYPQCFPLTITNLNPTAEVTNVTIDSSQLDLATPQGARFQLYLFGPNSKTTDQTTVLNVGNLSGQHLATTPTGAFVALQVLACGTVNSSNLTTRTLGNLTVSGQYTYSAVGGVATIGTTSTPVPVSYTFHPDVYAPPINLIHDQTISLNDLRPLDSNYPLYPVISERNVTGTFLNPQDNVWAGDQLVGFSQQVSNPVQQPVSKSDLLDILAATPFWRTSFYDATSSAKPLKTGFNGAVGDTATYDLSRTDTCNTDLVTCMKAQLSTSNRNLILANNNYLGLGIQWADRPVGGVIGGPDGYKVPVNILGVTSLGLVSGAVIPLVPLPTCSSVTVAGYYQAVGCGQILINIPITQKFEREAFNISLGVGAAVLLSNVNASIVVKNSSGNDASALFTLIVSSDPQGATTGGTVTGSENVLWQLIPKAGAGLTSGAQYSVSANFAYKFGGQSYSVPTQTVTITVTPLPLLQISYSVPYLAIQNKTEKVRISVTNTGTGPANNFTATAAQPQILANPSAGVNPAAFNWNFTVNGSSATAGGALQSGVTTINFGNIAPGATVSGYFGLVVSNCNYNDAALHVDCGYILDSVATLQQQDYNGLMLDSLVGTPTVQFVPALGGTVTQAGVAQPGLTVTATRAGVTLGSDTTDSEGGYFIGDLTVGAVTVTVTAANGTVLSTNTAATLLADSSTNFVDFALTPTTAVPVAITVGTSVAGLTFTVDGIKYTATQKFNWLPGDNHSISTVNTQTTAAVGTAYVFNSWTNGGAIAQSLTVPSIATTYTANFTTQYLLTTAVSPVNSGLFVPATGYVNAGAGVTLQVTPTLGYQFASFSGGFTGTQNGAAVTVNGPLSVVANMAPIAPQLNLSVTSKTGAANARLWTLTFSNVGTGIGLNTQVTSMTFTGTGCTTPPAITTPAGGISAAAPFTIGTINPLGSTSGNVTIDFSGCPTTTKFTVGVGYTANSGAYKSSTTLNNQFQ